MRLVFAHFLILFVACGSARALSPSPEYLPPTNYDLVSGADDVLLTVATDVRGAEDSRVVEARVEKSFKGVFAETLLEVPAPDSPGARRPRVGESRLVMLRKSRPAPAGAQTETAPTFDVTLSWTKEESEADPTYRPWVGVISRFVEVARLRDYGREKAALLELQQKAAADRAGSPPGLWSNIERHFTTPTAAKSYADLMELYEEAGSEEGKEKVVHALAQGLHREAFDVVFKHLRHHKLRGDFLTYMTRVKSPQRWHVLLDRFLRSPDEDERRGIAKAMAETATPAVRPIMLRALAGADGEEYSGDVIARWFVRNPSPAATELMKKRLGPDFRSNRRFYKHLVTLGDEELVGRDERLLWTADWLGATYTIGYSPTARADTLVREVIRRRDMDRLEGLVWALADEYNVEQTNPRRWERLKEIIALPGKTQHLTSELQRYLTASRRPEAKELLRMMTPAGGGTSTRGEPPRGR